MCYSMRAQNLYNTGVNALEDPAADFLSVS
jgi:hypothetical protein